MLTKLYRFLIAVFCHF